MAKKKELRVVEITGETGPAAEERLLKGFIELIEMYERKGGKLREVKPDEILPNGTEPEKQLVATVINSVREHRNKLNAAKRETAQAAKREAMTAITRILPWGSGEWQSVILECGHRQKLRRAEVKERQLAIGKKVECAECRTGAKK